MVVIGFVGVGQWSGSTGGGQIGDKVFLDNDGDGTFGAGETGIANITVDLWADWDGDGTYDQTVVVAGPTTL